jgi:hypothetical protein
MAVTGGKDCPMGSGGFTTRVSPAWKVGSVMRKLIVATPPTVTYDVDVELIWREQNWPK